MMAIILKGQVNNSPEAFLLLRGNPQHTLPGARLEAKFLAIVECTAKNRGSKGCFIV